MKKSIFSNKRLAFTLKYLTIRRTFKDFKYTAVIASTTINQIVVETCEAIITVLKDYIQANKIILKKETL